MHKWGMRKEASHRAKVSRGRSGEFGIPTSPDAQFNSYFIPRMLTEALAYSWLAG